MADVVISTCVSSFHLSPLSLSMNEGITERRADYIAHPDEVKNVTTKLLNRFKKVGHKLLLACKQALPANTVPDAMQAMRRALGDDLNIPHNSGLVETSISQSGVATIELNDKPFYNGLSNELVSDLLLGIQKLNVRNDLKALILCGSGAHFCTGGVMQDTKGERTNSLEGIQLVMTVAVKIRKLSIPTLAVIHGKVIGGGLALAMAADWRICPEGTTLNYGNLSRGMSCFTVILNLGNDLEIGTF